jgi:hypothetical protein
MLKLFTVQMIKVLYGTNQFLPFVVHYISWFDLTTEISIPHIPHRKCNIIPYMDIENAL